jgi:GTP-binding protein
VAPGTHILSAARVDSAEFVRSAYGRADFLDDGRPQVVFAGRSNVGKSSLLNRLLGRRALARVSSTPGRTRAVNYFLVNGRFYFVDLPGYGYAKASRDERREWARVVEEYLGQALPDARVVLLVDGKVGATEKDVEALRFFTERGAVVTVVATKIDRVPRGKRAAQLAAIRRALALPGDAPVIPVSAASGEGMKQLWSEVALHLEASRR